MSVVAAGRCGEASQRVGVEATRETAAAPVKWLTASVAEGGRGAPRAAGVCRCGVARGVREVQRMEGKAMSVEGCCEGGKSVYVARAREEDAGERRRTDRVRAQGDGARATGTRSGRGKEPSSTRDGKPKMWRRGLCA
jgi:hypothetical protein